MNHNTEQYQDIFANELELWRAKNATFIDVREPWEYARGHVPGAQNIPLGEIAEHAQNLAGPIVLICASGNRSSHAAQFLGGIGLTPIANLVGGTYSYAQSGLPLSQGV
jgi:rhodanese-related sulfurtransferase